jgi:hypothetical protein
MCRLAWMILLIAGMTFGTAWGDVVVLGAVRDNTLFEDATGSLSDGAGPVLFAGNNGQDLARRGLLKFDIAGAVPAGAHIDGAELSLNVSNTPNTTAREFTLHRVLMDWGEGTSNTTSGSGAPATANDATWLHTFYPAQFWASPGGDFSAAVSASQMVAGLGFYTWVGDGMAADVQSWLDQPTSTFGWLLQSDEVTLNTARRFDSRENATVANRPALTVYYTRTVDVAEAAVRSPIALLPCRPNPAAGPVRIACTLPARAHARLEVADVTGRRVATVLDGCFEPGLHEAVWDARDARGASVAAGVYVYRLVVDGRFAIARRLVVLR